MEAKYIKVASRWEFRYYGVIFSLTAGQLRFVLWVVKTEGLFPPASGAQGVLISGWSEGGGKLISLATSNGKMIHLMPG